MGRPAWTRVGKRGKAGLRKAVRWGRAHMGDTMQGNRGQPAGPLPPSMHTAPSIHLPACQPLHLPAYQPLHLLLRPAPPAWQASAVKDPCTLLRIPALCQGSLHSVKDPCTLSRIPPLCATHLPMPYPPHTIILSPIPPPHQPLAPHTHQLHALYPPHPHPLPHPLTPTSTSQPPGGQPASP